MRRFIAAEPFAGILVRRLAAARLAAGFRRTAVFVTFFRRVFFRVRVPGACIIAATAPVT